MSFLKYVECPTCETLISWRVLYSNNTDIAKASVGKFHKFTCPFDSTPISFDVVNVKFLGLFPRIKVKNLSEEPNASGV